MSGRAILTTAFARYPRNSAGVTWAFLQWALGFRSLGWDTWLVEELPASACIDAAGKRTTPDRAVNASYWRKAIAEFGWCGKATLFQEGEREEWEELRAYAREADLLLNISGVLRRRSLLDLPKRRIYLDLDPVFTSIWARQYGCDLGLAGHDVFVTVGLRMDQEDVRAPNLGVPWLTTLPPVVLDSWTALPGGGKSWTTVTHWRAYPEVRWGQWVFTNKAPEWERVLALPRLVDVPFRIACDLAEEEIAERFRAAGWEIVSSSDITTDWKQYRAFLNDSRGEFSVVKGGYRISNCGWFSDRSACYLSLGKPVVLQETGWSTRLRPPCGLHPFSSIDEAARAIERVESHYAEEAAGARAFAEEALDARKVIGRLLGRL
ncbi:hypothetical protein MAMC_00432 [Methylacidimicrobium cyclopophantes]|uniref:Glycosyltransferase family 1 protein n=1 Tax=Methylacidimicrobium cyclopophantes TaxID=1041766 RepID=A0A5E6MGG3_9BACT|nr:hypothetical protein [Methylacidimicrobium cyclopophantes]VVM05159.1 hypothetical protein MAMC_00432 [Methylacidimicrobium cyclopophantes]